jgi:hypothetical protein
MGLFRPVAGQLYFLLYREPYWADGREGHPSERAAKFLTCQEVLQHLNTCPHGLSLAVDTWNSIVRQWHKVSYTPTVLLLYRRSCSAIVSFKLPQFGQRIRIIEGLTLCQGVGMREGE